MKDTNRDTDAAIRKATATPTGPPLREQDAQFHELMAHLEQAFWIKNADDDAVLYISPAYETIWGRTCRSLYENYQTILDAIHPEDRERVTGALARQRDTAGYEAEFRILRPDGEVRWVWVRSYPVRDDQGALTRFAGIAEDVTARKSLEHDRARLLAIVEYSEDSIVSMSLDGAVISWNAGAERQYGYTHEEMIGRPISILFPPDHYQEYLQIMKQVRNGEAIPAYDTVRKCKDGTLINLSVNVAPIENRGGEAVGASKVAHDITRVKQLEEQFRQAQKMEAMGRLAAGVAHDFNNLITVISGNSTLLLDAIPAGTPARALLEEIRNAGERASALTRQLLLFSRKQAPALKVVDLNAIVASSEGMLRRLVGESVSLVTRPGDDLGRIRTDAGQMEQVLMNLVVNARDAMPGGGTITIATRNILGAPPELAAGRYVQLTVADTGTGIADEVKAHIFEALFTTKPLGRGTGLGLSTCQSIVEQSGGRIGLTSEVGQGTTFQIRFPRVEDALDVVAEAAGSPPLTSGTETLLVVEDDAAVRRLACGVLQGQGYVVLAAPNGQEALRVVRNHQGSPIRLVITDVIMPLMGGKVMSEWLKTTHPGLPVLFTSGYADNAIVHHGVLDPGVAFLSKPYTPATLARRVREMLDASPATVAGREGA